MKNIFKIATISALVMLSANATAEEANQDFTWTGTVPAANAGTGIKIKDLTSGATIDAGNFTLVKAGGYNTLKGYFDIVTASTLSFDVVTDDASEDHVDYYFTLTQLQVGSTGAFRNVDGTIYGDIDLAANGIPLLKDKKTTTAATAATDLTVSGGALYFYGDNAMIIATMLITDQAI
ncbi:hypothetical protein Sps_03960 [Shewanella psychrophila]|uniref:Uncharacterized protein n=1 Tax=Shewanella psychrophila TaxID=225848 RepID=A0A1S6HU45_9GAMM|nr:hypothetical protein [Shewanella psychrophila]AQS39075.1 hypothetical protein Sps_03960 [Shewanella psychrophila]